MIRFDAMLVAVAYTIALAAIVPIVLFAAMVAFELMGLRTAAHLANAGIMSMFPLLAYGDSHILKTANGNTWVVMTILQWFALGATSGSTAWRTRKPLRAAGLSVATWGLVATAIILANNLPMAQWKT